MGKLRALVILVGVPLIVGATAFCLFAQETGSATPAWSFDATIIEACTCTMFCPCYFGTVPAPHGMDHSSGADHGYCQFNMGYKVNKGKWGKVKLDGAKFWIAGDLGDDFGDGETEWAEVTFDPGVTKEQREAITTIVPNIYPVKWKSFTLGADAPVEWSATTARAHAKLDGGRGGEVLLVHNPTAMSPSPTVIDNLTYFAAPRNDGFVLMPNEVQAYRRGAHTFETKGTNGFMITLNINSKDVAARAASSGP